MATERRQARIVPVAVVPLGHPDDGARRTAEHFLAVGVRSYDRAVAGEGHSDGFGQAVHRIGGEHSGTRTASGAGASFQFLYVGIGHAGVGTHDHRIDQIDPASAEISGLHRPAGDEYRGDVQPHGGHEHPGSYLVAVADAHQGIGLVRIDHVFHAVSDDLARGQRIEHTVMPHGDPVVDGDGIELGGKATQGFHFGLDDLPHPVQMHVPGDELGKRIGDRDDRRPICSFFMPLAFHSARAPAMRRESIVCALRSGFFISSFSMTVSFIFMRNEQDRKKPLSPSEKGFRMCPKNGRNFTRLSHSPGVMTTGSSRTPIRATAFFIVFSLLTRQM